MSFDTKYGFQLRCMFSSLQMSVDTNLQVVQKKADNSEKQTVESLMKSDKQRESYDDFVTVVITMGTPNWLNQ